MGAQPVFYGGVIDRPEHPTAIKDPAWDFVALAAN
jgi:hypothetical protein